MKKRITDLLLLVLSVLLLSSCGTTVAMSTLVPAEINISGYKTIAVQSVKIDCPLQNSGTFIPIRGDVNASYVTNLTMFSHYTAGGARSGVASASNMFVKAMDAGFYNIVAPTETDAMVVLGRSNGSVRDFLIGQNVDAIVSISVSYANFDEYITSEKILNADSTVKGYNFYLTQTAALVITFTVTDVRNNSIIAVRTLTNTDNPFTIKTRIGHTDTNMAFVKDVYFIRSVQSVFEEIVSSFSQSVRSALTPNYVTVCFDLEKNKPEAESVKNAYKFVKDGYYTESLRLFLEEWNRSGHYASGYNAAILYYVLGDYENAFSLAERVYRQTGRSNAYQLYRELLAVKDRQDAANAQISGDKESGTKSEELVGF